jgi:MFS transporter, SP family, solute carrier family 2 (myo-inositol transporter), member 13
MIIYVASYATGLGNIPWQQGELFSLDGEFLCNLVFLDFYPTSHGSVRGIGTSLSTATNWSANFVIGATYLSLMDRITPAGAFGFYAGLCLLGWLFCLFCFPETAGLSLEEVQRIFQDGFGIEESNRLRKNKIRMKNEEKA